MMAWETEDEYCSPTVPAGLPTPAHSDVPSRKNSRASRRAARRSVTPPGRKSSSPPIPDKSKRSSKDITTDETISILDPRRFTPTLHANLVSEILTLRRDQEEKIKLIEQLESALHVSRQEQEVLEQTVVNTSKETRAVKRQLSLLEGGTSTAIGDLAKERDEAVETSTETKKKLETAQRKIKAQEEDSQRVHNQWAKEKNEWEEERRKFERKIHISESRLKIILDEVAAYQAQQQSQAAQGSNSEIEDGTDRENDSASIRSQRPASVSNSVRFSIISNRGLNSLADELDFGGDDEWIEYDDRRESLISINNAFRHSRTFSKDSTLSMTKGHARTQSIQSIDSLRRPSSGARGTLLQSTPVIEAPEDDISVNGTITGGDEDLDILDIDESMADVTVLERPMTPPSEISIEYVDTGVQFSPPSSPKLEAIMGDVISIPAVAIKIKMTRASVVFSRSDAEIEANQRRKRVHIGPPLTIEPVSAVSRPMISSGSQTIEAPLSPPKTPVSPVSPVEIISIPPTPIVRVSRPFKPTMVISYTQTEPIPQRRIKIVPQQVSVAPLPIPSISIVPPSSRPSSPHESRLPQHFKDFGCQVNMPPPQMVTSSVQTEPIRIDKRLAQLPPHLRPSAIRSRPTTPDEGSTDDPRNFTPIPGYLPPRNPRRLASQRSISDVNSSPPAILLPSEMPVDAYPGNNDDGPLSGERAPMRRPHRISSLFAGFDGVSSDDGEEYLDADSDNEYRTVLSAPKPKMGNTRPTKRGSTNAMGTSPEMLRRGSSRSSARTDMFPTYTLTENVEANGPIRRPSVRGKMFEKGGKAAGMRKAAIIQSGIVTHSTRPRSPSLPDGRDPPFPIPTRASSRRPPASASAPSDGSHSPSRRGSNRSHYRNNSIRKVRSAAALPRGGRIRRGGSRSPPPLSMSPMDPPTSPSLPPLPSSDLTSPLGRSYRNSSQYRRHRSQLSTTTANTALTANTANTGLTDLQSVTSQTTGVVDAIAQTMIGEWMFKYVRRRKSFGVPESSNREEPSNDRHKRWVWLAPYERAILWSSKQPSSNSILMGGKAGRKLLIQSVLDVKDDNPAPKGATQLFNRSILILTPQRALKFTSTSAERHYLWLTALSFLAHSSQAIPENLVPPNPDPVSFEIPPPVKTRRPGIRDSIRLTKSRHGMSNNFKAAAPPSIPSIPSLPNALSTIGDVMAFQARGSFSTQPSSNQSQHTRDQSRDAAEPPFIPRFSERAMHQGSLHGRKRSNTGGHVPPPLSFRGFSGPAGSSSYHVPSGSVAGTSINTAGSSDAYQQTSSGNTWAGSQRTSEASSRPSNNFFDAIGTVRMEAFISPLAYSQFDDDPDENDEFRASARRRSKEMRRRNSRSRNRDSYNSRWSGSRTGGEEDFFSRDDPFKGF
ncbi:hypothetical protein Cpir12675_005562 [Ceratocystis pirilliformis]|uniref:Pleckstrin homology domain-containing protein n=1 Tax=Ceratocystis pirilliformis TaxID=259994 RepID=A0ABR3YQ73_9PEZI